MIVTTISRFRKELKFYLNKVTENFDTLIIHRGNDQAVVMISLEEYNALMTTHHELSSKVNEQRLDSAIEKLKRRTSFP